MAKLPCCACCKSPLEPVQQLRFLVESDNLDNPSYLNRIRSLPSVNGTPVPVCKACQTHLDANPRLLPKPKPTTRTLARVLGVFGALSAGLLLGSFFTSRG